MKREAVHGRHPNAADLEQLLAERGRQLMQAAIALTGSRQAGEDLLQAALERCCADQAQ